MAPNTNLLMHFVFVTKYRKPIIHEEMMDYIKEIITEEMTYRGCEVISINGDNSDHIHVMLEIKPTQSVSLLSQIMKQTTRYRVWNRYPELRKHYWYKNYLWSDGYYCATIGNHEVAINTYIDSQGTNSPRPLKRY
jgi:putative transposase